MTNFIVKRVMKQLSKSGSEASLVTFNETGKLELSVNKLYGLCGVISLILGVIVLILFAISDGSQMKSMLSITALFIGLGAVLVGYFMNTSAVISHDELTYVGMTKKIKKLKWHEIEKVTFNKNSQELILTSKADKIKFHSHLIGFGSLVEIIRTKLDKSIYKDAIGE